MVEYDSQEGAEQRHESFSLRVLTAISWCGRSSGWQKKMARGNTPVRRSPNNRVAPSDSSESSSSSSSPVPPKFEKPKPLPNFAERSEELTDQYKLFCPICMYYYAETFRTTCCNHHICCNCTQDMLWANNKEIGEIHERSMQDLPCPHCSAESLAHMQRITLKDKYRHYEDSPGICKETKTRRFFPSNKITPSPLKIGDTYENMMKKMLTYDQCGISIHASTTTATCTPGRTISPPPAPISEGSEYFLQLPGSPEYEIQSQDHERVDGDQTGASGLEDTTRSSSALASTLLLASTGDSRSVLSASRNSNETDDSRDDDDGANNHGNVGAADDDINASSSNSVDASPAGSRGRRTSISSMQIPVELQRPSAAATGRPPRPAGLEVASSRVISSRASSPAPAAFMDRVQSPSTPGPRTLLQPLESPARQPSPQRAQMYLIVEGASNQVPMSA